MESGILLTAENPERRSRNQKRLTADHADYADKFVLKNLLKRNFHDSLREGGRGCFLGLSALSALSAVKVSVPSVDGPLLLGVIN